MLNQEQIEYLVVGGYAVAYHGYLRPTDDLDVWVAVAHGGDPRIIDVLAKFGFVVRQEQVPALLAPGAIIRMGVPPVRIEVLNTVSGLRFPDCYARRIVGLLDDVTVNLLHRDDLLANKRAAGRWKDLADIDKLSRRRPPG